MNPPKTVEASLRTPDEVRVFLRKEGPFQYALEGSTDSKDAFLRPNEWLFGDDLIALLKMFLQWDKRSAALEYR